MLEYNIYKCFIFFFGLEQLLYELTTSFSFSSLDIVNCTAETGLDKLTKHYSDVAIGFNIFFFLPDTDHKEYASYVEFLRYLSAKYCFEVAKLSNGTHMFLVPPSDFISKVLKVDGPACI